MVRHTHTHTHLPLLLMASSSYSLAHSHPLSGLCPFCRGSLDHEYEYERAGEMDAALEDGQFEEEEDETRDRVYFDTVTRSIVGNLDASTESDNSSVDGGATVKVAGGRARSSSTASNPGITDDERARARKFRTGSFNGTRTGKTYPRLHLPVSLTSHLPFFFAHSRPCVHRSYFRWRL
jgi:hypothetical protein